MWIYAGSWPTLPSRQPVTRTSHRRPRSTCGHRSCAAARSTAQPNQLANLLPLGSATISYRGSEIVLWVNVGEVVDRSSPSAAPSPLPTASDGQPVASIPTIDAWVLRPRN
jgi:hypothetical protein